LSKHLKISIDKISEGFYVENDLHTPKHTQSKCIEAVTGKDRTWIAGVPTRRSYHLAVNPRLQALKKETKLME
jgi:hypothetical protein